MAQCTHAKIVAAIDAMGERDRTIDQRLRDTGYSHCSVSNRGLYRHAVWRTDDGALIGYMRADEAVEFLQSQETAKAF